METAFDLSFKTDWDNVCVIHKEGFYTSIFDFHKHEFYEINLILTGNVKIILSSLSEETNEPRLVLTRPQTPHFITCNPDTLYSRLYLLFTKDFLQDYFTDFKRFEKVFGESGNILKIDTHQLEFIKSTILLIEKEKSTLRQKLLTLYLLSFLFEINGQEQFNTSFVPPYIIKALSYIENYYNEKITADSLSKKLFIGRTTLMTSFKKHTGSTLNDYVIATRINKAVTLLNEGKSESETAELCGFSDAGSLIRNFRKYFDLTPKQYIKKQTHLF